jgi:hypothetical protein
MTAILAVTVRVRRQRIAASGKSTRYCAYSEQAADLADNKGGGNVCAHCRCRVGCKTQAPLKKAAGVWNAMSNAMSNAMLATNEKRASD